MSDKTINVEAILSGYKREQGIGYKHEFIDYEDAKEAIKEAIEAAIDLCAEEANLTALKDSDDSPTGEVSNGIFQNASSQMSDFDRTWVVNKDSILSVKKMINYE